MPSTSRGSAGLFFLGVLLAATAMVSCRAQVTNSGQTGARTGPDVAQLEALLPSAAQVGADYLALPEIDEDDDGDTGFDEAIERACPEVAARFGDDTGADRSDSVSRDYETSDGRSFVVQLTAYVGEGQWADRDDVAEFVELAASCEDIELADEETETVISLAVDGDDTHGEVGLTIEVTAHVTGVQVPFEFDLEMAARQFVVGDVGVFVTATGSIDPVTGASVPPDRDAVESVAARLVGELDRLGEPPHG